MIISLNVKAFSELGHLYDLKLFLSPFSIFNIRDAVISKNIYPQSYTIDIKDTIKSFFFPSQYSAEGTTNNYTDEELHDFLEILRDSLEADLPDHTKFEILFDTAPSQKMKNVALYLQRSIMNEGISFSISLQKAGFPNFITTSLEMGGQAGSERLIEIYDKLLYLLKNKIEIKNKIRKMLMYPMGVVLFLLAYFDMILLFIIPKSKELYSIQDPKTFPPLTKKFIVYSDWAVKQPYTTIALTYIGGIIAVIVLYKLIKKVIPYLPLLKKLNTKTEVSLLFNMLSTASSASMQLSKSVELAKEVSTNPKMRARLDTFVGSLENGETLSYLLEINKFDKEIVYSVKAGEETSKLGYYFDKISKKLDKAIFESFDKLAALVTPATILAVATCIVTLYYIANAPLFNFKVDTGTSRSK